MRITQHKTKYGFEYRVGNLNIARGRLYKGGHKNMFWKVELFYLKSRDIVFGIAVMDTIRLEITEVMPFLNNLIAGGDDVRV